MSTLNFKDFNAQGVKKATLASLCTTTYKILSHYQWYEKEEYKLLISSDELDAETLKIKFASIRKELHDRWQPILDDYNRKFGEQKIEITLKEPMYVFQIIATKLSLLADDTTDEKH